MNQLQKFIILCLAKGSGWWKVKNQMALSGRFFQMPANACQCLPCG